MARVRRKGPDRRPGVTDSAWAWFTGATLDADGEATFKDLPDGVNPFDLLAYVYPTNRMALDHLTVQWTAAREAVLDYWRRQGRPMPELVLNSVRKVATEDDVAVLENPNHTGAG